MAVGDTFTTDSLKVAAVFGKRHDHVLRAIRNLMAELPEKHRPNFGETVDNRPNPSGGDPIPSPCYRITRDGFTPICVTRPVRCRPWRCGRCRGLARPGPAPAALRREWKGAARR